MEICNARVPKARGSLLYELSYFGLTAEREEDATRLQSRKLEEWLL